MPYIKKEERGPFDEWIAQTHGAIPHWSSGQLNYVLTSIVKEWVGAPSYTKIAAVTGVVENVKQELYRRLASPYEDTKIAENGDVY